MDVADLVAAILLVAEYAIKVLAIGTVPEGRRPGSSSAWLLLILLVPVLGLPLFLLLGSPYVKGRRHRIQAEANRAITDRAAGHPLVPAGITVPPGLGSIVALNRRLTGMPCLSGRHLGLHGHYEDAIAAMAEAVRGARHHVHVEFYIVAWDDTTDVFFSALADAVRRGVTVRLLYDQLGSARYPGYEQLRQRLSAAGIQWYPMMPISLWQRRWRRPDLRNHRKLVVVDGERAFMGSQNMIDSSYLRSRGRRPTRRWEDLNIELDGPVVDAVSAVFSFDWYTETGELLPFDEHERPATELPLDPGSGVFQLVPSGPGFPTEPNLRLFVSLIHRAQHRVSIVSPYFVPDESLLAAVTTAAHRGVEVELFASAQGDQFMVQHAQHSYYTSLLDAGVRIYLYPAPAVLHAKFFTVDDEVGVIGSSNMDMRSFALDYEITLMGFGGTLVHDLAAVQQSYRAVSTELTAEAWRGRPPHHRYVDNVCRLTSALQ